jgi:arsenate reductase
MSEPIVTIYHNPACGTSRNTLAMIRNAGIEPVVIEYLKTPPSRAELAVLAKQAGGARTLLREKDKLVAELGLNADVSDDTILDAIAAHPILLNRPVVVTPKGTKSCRPSEVVLDLLPTPQHGAFTKEDGEAVVDATGPRIAKG